MEACAEVENVEWSKSHFRREEREKEERGKMSLTQHDCVLENAGSCVSKHLKWSFSKKFQSNTTSLLHKLASSNGWQTDNWLSF